MKKTFLNGILMLALAPLATLAPATLAAPHGGPSHVERHRVARTAPDLGELSIRMHESAAFALREARLGLHRPGRREHDALRALERLERESARFERAVNRRGPTNFLKIERELDDLTDAYHVAAVELRDIRARRMRDNLNEMAFLLDRIERRVELLADYRPRPRRDRGPEARGSVAYRSDDGRFFIRLGF